MAKSTRGRGKARTSVTLAKPKQINRGQKGFRRRSRKWMKLLTQNFEF